MIRADSDDGRCVLTSPTAMPKASGFLWNEKMMIQASCRGYAVAQFMQPEPAKYSHAPNLEAKTFMQPEQPFYAHHPGRFVYVKDEQDGRVFSAPYEPVRVKPDMYRFSVGQSNIRWEIEHLGIGVEMCLSLPKEEALELWRINVINRSERKREISIYPYFTVGYMSWMNQGGAYNADLQAIVCSSVTPYQKYKDYFTIKDFKDQTFLLSQIKPDAWEVNQEVFEGEGGLSSPSAVMKDQLDNGKAQYEIPVCVFQYRLSLEPGEEKEFRFIFGPAKNEEEIWSVRRKYFPKQAGKIRQTAETDKFKAAAAEYSRYIAEGKGCIQIQTADKSFDHFVNHWMARQVYYHGKTNRLSLDPQTRNYLQDSMGMSYINPEITKQAFIKALSQQHESGAMPDGIKLHKDAELKYINQIPHTDHCVWLSICLKAYLDETDDYEILNEMIPFADSHEVFSVFEHIDRGMNWLLSSRDERGLNYIAQGDWCDPMNMVGYKGRGVSGWLTAATAYALLVWSDICHQGGWREKSLEIKKEVQTINQTINHYLWDGQWYARGITDDNVRFGVSSDREGRIYLNPQGWAILSGAADQEKQSLLLEAVREYLETPYGLEMLAPAYTSMREDVGRLTQKYPGSAENGSVYNHAAAFYIYALYSIGESQQAYHLLRKMIPGPDTDDLLQRGQLPIFIPNYYRGAYRQIPETAGRSSQLFNTGTVSWFYRCIIDGLFGLKGNRQGLTINPQLPVDWKEAQIRRVFRGSVFHIEIKRVRGIKKTEVYVDHAFVENGVITEITPGAEYHVLVKIPHPAS